MVIRLQNILRIMIPNVVFVLGGPGAGKGTQCQRIYKVNIDDVHVVVARVCTMNGISLRLQVSTKYHTHTSGF